MSWVNLQFSLITFGFSLRGANKCTPNTPSSRYNIYFVIKYRNDSNSTTKQQCGKKPDYSWNTPSILNMLLHKFIPLIPQLSHSHLFSCNPLTPTLYLTSNSRWQQYRTIYFRLIWSSNKINKDKQFTFATICTHWVSVCVCSNSMQSHFCTLYLHAKLYFYIV